MNISRHETVGKKSNKTIFLLIFFSTLFTLSFYSQDVYAQTSDGTVSSEQKISDTAGGFGGVLDDTDAFGFSLVNIGDLNGDGVEDLAVGARLDDDGGQNRGAIWILFMNSDGTVASEQKISSTTGGFGGPLANQDSFGYRVASIGDLDNDGVTDLAVTTPFSDDGGQNRGAIWILFMNSDGTVSSEQKISDTAGGFGGGLDNADTFGTSIANLGDLDGDGVNDLAVGVAGDDDGGFGDCLTSTPQICNGGAIWILFMNSDGTVASEQKISATTGGFGGVFDVNDNSGFGSSLVGLGDFDGDGVKDLATGILNDDDGGTNRGAVWILFMNSDGTVSSEQKISDTAGGFGGVLNDSDLFGTSIAKIGDLNEDGVDDLVVGSIGNDDGGLLRGAVWILFMNSDGTVSSEQKISDTVGGFGGVLDDIDLFGAAVTQFTDLNGDGIEDLVVSTPGDDDGGNSRGAIWILFLKEISGQDEVIYDNGAPNIFLGFQAGPDNIQADDFVLDNPASLTDVHFWIVDNGENFDNQVEYFVYSVDGSFPGDLIASGQGQNVQTMLDVLNECDSDLLFTTCFEVSLDLEEPVPLDADTTYWIGLRIPSATSSPLLGLLVSDDNAGGFSLAGSTDGVNWSNINRDTLPFSLTGIPDDMLQADLSIIKSDSVDPVLAGDTLSYDIAFQNNGPQVAENVVITDTFPVGVTFLSAPQECSESASVVTCNFGNIVSLDGGQFTIEVTVDSQTTGVIRNTVTITSDTADPNPNNNSAIEDTTVSETPIEKFFNELVSILQTFTIQVLKPISPEPFNQLVSIVQGTPEIDVFQPLSPSPFNQLVSIVQGTPEIDVFQPLSPPAFSQQVAINQDFTAEIISEENTIEQLFANIETADLDSGITNALLATLKNIEVNLTPLEFSATSLVTTSSKSSIDEVNSKKQNNEVCGKLDAFINKVNALTGKKINPEDAASFIATAEGIKENFGCT